MDGKEMDGRGWGEGDGGGGVGWKGMDGRGWREGDGWKGLDGRGWRAGGQLATQIGAGVIRCVCARRGGTGQTRCARACEGVLRDVAI